VINNTCIQYKIMNEQVEEFFRVTQTLFQERYLLIAGQKYQICEVEYYLYSDSHPDSYTHKHPEQLQYGKWHFHRASNRIDSGYKSGTRKGLDLTLSCNDDSNSDNEYFSVLIRSIYSFDTKQMITGPCNVVDHILKKYGVVSIDELQSGKESFDADNNWRNFVLCNIDYHATTVNDHLPIYFGPRVGLGASKDPFYVDAYYRFVQRYEKIKKNKRKLTMYPCY
jgi:hypothetical protein